ncbi:hypothetical protein PROFUN_14275 [Planoprotostelium fungivorum]|uniref:Uncharacterized protein n=1 Tax=Planoprotostelium fungivorum TaxID=1890364 RepID=A0A2P6N0F5_9EUKA|nr:hypothetical protein PROFUN_14275 [Planoprotostelium fungivorum]
MKTFTIFAIIALACAATACTTCNDTSALGSLLGSIFNALLSVKGITVSAAYTSNVYIHADISTNIAIDLSIAGSISPLSSLIGSILPLSSIINTVQPSATVLNIQTTADVKVSVTTFTDVSLALPLGYALVNSSSHLLDADVKVGFTIALSADVDATASIVTPALNWNGDANQVGLLKVNKDNSFAPVACVWNANTGRIIANLGADAGIAGTYLFVGVTASL